MKCTMLAIVITMSVSALYSFQNLDTVKVRFLFSEWNFPQGVWEIGLFCAGVILMWLLSLLAQLETKNKYKRQIKALNDKLYAIEEEKKNVVDTVSNVPSNSANSKQTAFENTDTTETADSILLEDELYASEKE
ncbi:MAG: LapA family protein [Synergistaceae bacterium]|nr:LapA family protein [Synergistaceae bacterium]